jgi:hypothetical protein
MKRLLSILKRFLLLWGAFSLIVCIAATGFMFFRLRSMSIDRTDQATNKDVRFVLNWCGLGDQRIEKVIHSFASARNITGDHTDAYAIKITHVAIEELTPKEDLPVGRWYRGDQLPKSLDQPLELVLGWCEFHKLDWFPKTAEVRSSDMYVYPWSVDLHGIEPNAAKLIFVRPKDNMVFYTSTAM